MSATARSPRSGRVAALIVLAALFAVGCGLTLSFGPAVVNRCASEEECAGGACVEGRCISTAVEPAMSVFFEVVPAPDPLLPSRAPVVFAPVSVVGPVGIDLPLPPETIVSGGAFFGETGLRVPVQVTFTPRPGFEAAPRGEARATSDADDYAVLLELGRTYDIVVEPTGASVAGLADVLDQDVDPQAVQAFPPLYLEAGPEIVAGGVLDFSYPESLFEACGGDAQDGCTLGGRVASVDDEGTELAANGLVVRAVDESGRVVSSSTLTDAAGAFVIRIMPDAGPYVLRVTAPEDVPLPSVEVEVDFDVEDAERMILLPRLSPVTLQNYVGYYLDGVPFAVDHAAVAFESVALDDLGLPGELFFRRTAFTETPVSGPSPFTLSVVPGTYRVIVTPAESDRAGLHVFAIDIDERSAEPGIAGQNYLVPLRARLFGAVRTPMGDPVPLAGLRARRLATPSTVDAADVLRFGRSSEATADPSGAYVLPLDVGTFDLVVKPGEGTGYAWEVVPDVSVAPDQGDFAMDVTLSPPVPISGTVLEGGGGPLAGALVRAYVLLGSGETLRAVQIGEATTDGAGAYDVLLPGGL